MKTTKKIICAPDLVQLEPLMNALARNGYLVLGEVSHNDKNIRSRAISELENVRTSSQHVRCAVWFVRTDEAEEMYVEVAPTSEEIIDATVAYRRRHPDDLFESFRVEANIQAPMYGLAGSLAGEFGLSSDWKRDVACPMFITVSKVVPMTEEEIAEAEAEAARKKEAAKAKRAAKKAVA